MEQSEASSRSRKPQRRPSSHPARYNLAYDAPVTTRHVSKGPTRSHLDSRRQAFGVWTHLTCNIEFTLLNAVGEGRNASVQREFRGGPNAYFPRLSLTHVSG
ncbi:DUF1589 domain-containing protein [Rhodopirellula baltica]|uniref:DUF1589 domain-containing protein n=1 Tax=Rhodopirellula baltica TaxID=265606 RepID=UPI001E3DC5BC|nr:DUF1589 domain-containing protein [Rhodopirellula baltica]